MRAHVFFFNGYIENRLCYSHPTDVIYIYLSVNGASALTVWLAIKTDTDSMIFYFENYRMVHTRFPCVECVDSITTKSFVNTHTDTRKMCHVYFQN